MNRAVFALKLVCWAYAFATTCHASDIEVSIKSDKSRYRAGDNISLTITYINKSENVRTILPQTESYPVDALTIEKTDNKKSVEKLRPGEVPLVAWEERARKAVTLKPGQKTTRKLVGEVRKQLPIWFEDSRVGLFVIFPASAVSLPANGQYMIRAVFHSSPDHPVNQYLPSHSKLWRGDATSDPISITIGE